MYINIPGIDSLRKLINSYGECWGCFLVGDDELRIQAHVHKPKSVDDLYDKIRERTKKTFPKVTEKDIDYEKRTLYLRFERKAIK